MNLSVVFIPALLFAGLPLLLRGISIAYMNLAEYEVSLT